jgi:twitching motility protein PilT
MEKILTAAIERGASDLHIKAGDVFRARINGELVALSKQPLTPDQTKSIVLNILPTQSDKDRIDDILDFDCSWGLSGVGRFRVSIFRQRGSFAAILRVIPIEIPKLDTIGTPDIIKKIVKKERGMILVTGVTGSGKSTTQAAMIDHLNETTSRHILTLEDPIEFLHRNGKCSISQREIGTDTVNFRDALKYALRQDPNVILIGEMRDAESIDIAMKAAETGHLVISTLHTQDTASTIARMIAVFPEGEQSTVRMRLSESLAAIISQRLLPKKVGKGRVVATEILVATETIRACIAEENRLSEIRNHIAEGRLSYGMQTFDQSLAELVKDDKIDFEVALAAASNPHDFELQMKLVSNEYQVDQTEQLSEFAIKDGWITDPNKQ